jgi:hypothetical protein
MADYQLTAYDDTVLRTADGAAIPNDPANRDYVEFLAWEAAGGVLDPYVPPEPVPPTPTGEQTVLYDHENRVRALEGKPPLTMADFIAKMQ